jgi:hypothetical protein
MLLRTGEFIKLLQEQDPTGLRVISFEVYDEFNPDELVAHGEITEIQLFQKNGRQTDEGDRDILKLSIKLDCNV